MFIKKVFPYVFFFVISIITEQGLCIKNFLQNCDCGKSNAVFNRRIVGGQSTEPHQFPWLVALMISGRLHCGGGIITDRHVLTAGHCITFGVSATDLSAYVGMHDREDGEKQIIGIERGIIHPEFTSNQVRDINDIAVLTLAKRLTFNENVRPICLPSQGEVIRTDKLTVAGWGRIRGNGRESSRYLLQTQVQIVSDEDCTRSHVYKINFERNSMMCAYAKGKDACQGDSGGPLFTERSVNSGKWYQTGIVSWGIDCAKPNFPGVYTIVSKFVKWIESQTENGNYCMN